MSRSQHAFAKRQRELAKKKKADEKRARRQNKGVDIADADGADGDIEGVAESAESTGPGGIVESSVDSPEATAPAQNDTTERSAGI